MPDPLAASLSGYRERLARPWTDATFGTVCTEDAPRLLAAVERALKAADDVEQVPALHGYECADRIRAAIAAALTGEEAQGD
jgi:hypothetical protein